VVAAQLHLGGDREDAAGDVLAELAEEEDVQGRAGRQPAAQVREQRPPHQGAGQQPDQDGQPAADHAAGPDRPHGEPRLGAVLAQRQPEQDHCERQERDAQEPPEAAGRSHGARLGAGPLAFAA
jgi:hypothetical protein